MAVAAASAAVLVRRRGPVAQVVELGGLHVVGTERHESRRIDQQLRGRAGRQGDPGSSRFFLALDDKCARARAQASKHESAQARKRARAS